MKCLSGEKGTTGELGRNGTNGIKGETGSKGEAGHINQTLIKEILLNLTGK